MGSVNYSVPDDVKDAFNETFKAQNKSAVIAELMREAVERERRRRQHQQAAERILKRREHAPAVSDAAVRKARTAGRS